MKTFINMLRDEAGASAAEYALILAIVGAAIALAAVTLGRVDCGCDERTLRTASTRAAADARPAAKSSTALEYRGRHFGGGPLFPVSVANSPQQLTRVLNKRLRETRI